MTNRGHVLVGAWSPPSGGPVHAWVIPRISSYKFVLTDDVVPALPVDIDSEAHSIHGYNRGIWWVMGCQTY